ncbi:MAG: hypothetical protein M3367_04360 [Acidobacteriota bacterium]|nr:hypothetical protein [Acidobacteriota bacterium]
MNKQHIKRNRLPRCRRQILYIRARHTGSGNSYVHTNKSGFTGRFHITSGKHVSRRQYSRAVRHSDPDANADAGGVTTFSGRYGFPSV